MNPPPRASQLDQAIALHQQGKFEEAETLYRQILTRDPSNAAALNALGMLGIQAGHLQGGAELIAKAVSLRPDDPAYQNNLAVAFARLKRAADAEKHWRRAMTLSPGYVDPITSLAQFLAQQDRIEEAIELWNQALRLRPDDVETISSLGLAMYRLDRFDESEKYLRRAISLRPNEAWTYRNLGIVLRWANRFSDCAAAFLKAVELSPDDSDSLNGAGDALLQEGRYIEATELFRRAVAEHPEVAGLHSNLLLALHYDPKITDEQLHEEHLKFGRVMARDYPRTTLPPRDRDPGRPIRVAYLSPYFHRHAVAIFSEPMITAHDAGRFIISCYADSRQRDEVTRRFKQHAEHWHETADLSGDKLVELIAKNGEDILVDLTGHIAGNRLPVFVRKPAPIQVTYLGYQNTSGLDAMDYRITDAFADPPGKTDHFYTERLVRLPSFFCYQPSRTAPNVAALPAAANGFVTFGSLNNPPKFNERVVALWARLLERVKNSRLMLLVNAGGATEERFGSMFAAEGIDAKRLIFAPRRATDEYLALYNQIDIGLDPFPFSGHTTTCDALWMGVPVITLAGDRYVARMTTSVLHQLGATDWIAQSPEAYLDIAANMAADLPSLAKLRSGLRNRVAGSPIADNVTFTRNLEAAYRKMWADWCASA